jgi:O-methyltransferase involved in polyketide biosynthesis
MSDSSSSGQETVKAKLDTGVPHPARVQDYWLGGKDNFAADRQVGDEIVAAAPELPIIVRAERQFLGRVVRYVVGEVGVRQILDIGTGIPTANNTHEVAQSVASGCRVVYVDNDPMVLAHARALLVGTPETTVNYVDADLREPEPILAAAARTLDFSQPVLLMLLGVLEFIPDDEQAYAVVDHLLAALPSGSYLAAASSIRSESMDKAAELWNASGATPITLRTPETMARFFRGLELVPPGLVELPQWRPEADTSYTDRPVPQYGGLGRK